jgi:hypothetical protein
LWRASILLLGALSESRSHSAQILPAIAAAGSRQNCERPQRQIDAAVDRVAASSEPDCHTRIPGSRNRF